MKLSHNTRIIQYSNQGHYGVYIFENVFNQEYLDVMLKRTLEVTEGDPMKRRTNVQADMSLYKALINDEVYTPFVRTTSSLLQTCILLRTPHWHQGVDVNFVDFWGMQFKKGDNSVLHTHMGQMFSGVFYIRSEDETRICFPDLNASEVAKSNTLYLFPGICPHYSTKSQSEIPRVALSFNIMINEGGEKWVEDKNE
tara:strand:- start:166 stop:756 length:591 start_codon:yes stop_codon:yes gene_type:complete